MSERLFNRMLTEIHLQKHIHFGTAHEMPGAGAGDRISGGFHFPIYTFRFSLNRRRLARADLVIRKKR